MTVLEQFDRELMRAIDAYLTAGLVTRRDELLVPIAGSLERDVASYFGAQRRMVLRAFATTRPLFEEAVRRRDVEQIAEEVNRRTSGLLRTILGRALARALLQGLRDGVIYLEAEPSFDLAHPAAAAWLSEHGAERVSSIGETTRERLGDIAEEATREGWSYGRTASEIRREFDEFSRARAELIAVTEVGEAYEEGTLEVGRELERLGLTMEKNALDVGDERECPVCHGNAAQGWIPIAQPFLSGHQRPLFHPGCRCALRMRRQPRPEPAA